MADIKGEKWIFIVNPIAGNGFAKTMVPEIEEKIKKYNIDGEIVLTERSGHASDSPCFITKKDTGILSESEETVQ